MTQDALRLQFGYDRPADAARGIVPYRHYRILVDGQDVGRINLRTASTRLTDTVIGHIGFAVEPAHRGHGYARRACLALIPDVRRFMPSALITCNPDNLPSRRTIEALGATPLGEFPVPEDIRPQGEHAASKLLYRWTP